ncbi:TfoX/Sxy family DNA transformation protein [Nocardia sp. 2]|uniref:TfoX/Sxy family DNA transformation protein n=1 Tax=Nocardia acididurans TaxID=2802282 RepID=A0ABS1M2Q8_9NOCA|nr:TfoX/Sxy family DNA transformation protein [Nocardia acididurans]MBL1074840.1 TfoX/Sxy family DNA transformation protein [Nocardia acididurans]
MKQQRPATARSIGDGLKLHRHLVRSVNGVHTVITLRAGTRARFSTNRFHDTWHVLSDEHGARLLARLLWGLSYQARPGTFVYIDRQFLTPTPFDADPADPIALVPGWCTPFDDRVTHQLKRHALPKPEGTVRWQTFGMDRTLEPAALDAWWERYHATHRGEGRGQVDRRRGVIVLSPATPEDARAWALSAAGLDTTRHGSDHTYLGPWDYGYDGEIQVFRRFRPMVSVAAQARAQVLSRATVPEDPEDLRAAVWTEAESVRGDAHLKVREWRDRSYVLSRAAAAMLAHANVATLEDLAAIGPVEAYRRMRAADVKNLTLQMLWAMEGALTYRDRHSIPLERRRELLADLGATPAPAPPVRVRYRAPIRRSPSIVRGPSKSASR